MEKMNFDLLTLSKGRGGGLKKFYHFDALRDSI